MTSAPATHIAANASHGTHGRRHQPSKITAGTAIATKPPARASTSAAATAASQYPARPAAGPPGAERSRGPRRGGQAAAAINTLRTSTDPASSQWYPAVGVKV